MVGKRFKSFYENGLYDVSCDILLGLAGTTAESILEDIRHILTEYQPRRIDVFSLTPTHSYVERYFEGSFEAFWEHLKPFQELVIPQLSKVAKETGYDYSDGNGHHMMLERGKKLIKPHMYTKSLWGYNALAVEVKKPIHLLGLGRSARSQIFGYAAFSPVTRKDKGRTRTDLQNMSVTGSTGKQRFGRTSRTTCATPRDRSGDLQADFSGLILWMHRWH